MTTKLNIGETTTDTMHQPPEEWWDIPVSLVWAEETLKSHALRFKRLEAEWQALVELLAEGDQFRRFAAPGTDPFGVASGFVIVRAGKPIATLALPKWTAIDRFTCDLARPDWLGEMIPFEAASAIVEHCKDEWDAMQSMMLPGDQIRRFKKVSNPLCGVLGLALVRNGEVIASFVTVRI